MDILRIISLVKETKGIITNREMAAHVKEKGVADYVTQVDVAVQDFLKKALYTLAPDIQFLGEETGLQRMDTDSYWILDPVDGTTNLMHDYQHSVVSLALCRQKEIVMGIVYDPFHDELFSAVKGEGSFLNGKPIHVSSANKLSETIIGIGTAKRELAKENFARFFKVYEKLPRCPTAWVRSLGAGIYRVWQTRRVFRGISEPLGLCCRYASGTRGRRKSDRLERQRT